ncbi:MULTISPECIES: hypothetical protein [Amycolatopsis]|uniref:Uncharacterized protein n=1 Tax=Amycolatopsis dendrobii TaxID=2760662 RepID=A0A7W3W399_9PSEU|nr:MULTISPECIES: hypothetical protein [Amycolatopsis]MBB1158049.1 hypothetical protein [Amycolatopsis dendrobii]UKD57157.1 hypothetical protein L3Q65_10660 [Amycolatopsis sp. FU40]
MTEPRRPITVLSQRRRVIRGDASLIVGLPWTTGLQYLALVAAAAVDVVAFDQVLEEAINEEPWKLWILVGGFTVVCLALSHFAGKQWKEASVQRHAPNARSLAAACGGVWLTLGLAAFLFRWFYVSSDQTGTTVEVEGQSQSQLQAASGQASHLSAILFLALYLGTGVLSGAMAYKLHNPAAQQWARAVAKRAKAAARLADLEAGLVVAQRLSAQVREIRQRADQDMRLHFALLDSLEAKLVADARIRLLGSGADPGERRPPAPEAGENNPEPKDGR